MTWTCGRCGADVDDELPICWQCGAGKDGSPPPEGWRSELDAPSRPAPRELACLRCATGMTFAGNKRFYEGSYSADILLGDFFIHREAFEVYACPQCGKVEFFASQRGTKAP
jgi:hypothetical protein